MNELEPDLGDVIKRCHRSASLDETAIYADGSIFGLFQFLIEKLHFEFWESFLLCFWKNRFVLLLEI